MPGTRNKVQKLKYPKKKKEEHLNTRAVQFKKQNNLLKN